MSSKRILIYSQTFYPDHSGISVYSSDFAFYCSQVGYQVDVITGFPFYPQWTKQKIHQRKLFATEKINGVVIHRGYLYVPAKPTAAKRIIHELSLTFFALLNSFRVKKPDVIIVFTTPVLLGVLGGIMKFFWKRPLVINVQDFQIEAAYSLGMLNGSAALSIVSKLELWSYKQADFVSSISTSMIDLLKTRKKLPERKVLYWPNWLQGTAYQTQAIPKGTFCTRMGLQKETKLIGYAGNVGVKQGLDILIDLANEFRNDESLLFLIIGDGSDLQRLKNYAEQKKVTNLRFISFLTQNEYQEFLSDASAVFISQVKVPFDIYFPSKLLGIMAMKQLLLVSADKNSELYITLKNYNLGLLSEYGDLSMLKQHVDLIAKKDTSLEDYRRSAEDYVKRFERDVVLSSVLKVVDNAPTI